MRYGLRTFGDIVKAVMEQLKIQASDTVTLNRVKRNINMVYLSHVVPAANWDWLNETISLTTEPYFEGGDASVQQNLVTVTLTQAPPTSKTGYYFTTNTCGQVYRIATHAPGSMTLTLETPFNGATNPAAKYKIWTDRIPLPADCLEVKTVTTTSAAQPINAVSMQQMRKHQISGGASIGSPSYYAEGPAEMPEPFSSIPGLPQIVGRSSKGLVKTIHFDAEPTMVEAGTKIRVLSPLAFQYEGNYTVSKVEGTSFSYTGRYALDEAQTSDMTLVVMQESIQNLGPAKHLYIFPALMQRNQRVTLIADYSAYASELIAENDEPLIPFEHRNVLFEGAMWLSCDRNTDAERSETHRQLMEQILSRMLIKAESAPKMPSIRASNSYLNTKRGGLFRRRGASYYSDGLVFGGNPTSGSPVATGTPNTVAVFDENGWLIGSPTIDLTALEFLVGTEGGQEATLTPSTTVTVNAWDGTKYKGLKLQYQIFRGTAFRHGELYVNTNGAIATFADLGPTEIQATGVDFDADIFAGQIRVLANVDNSGPTGLLKYKVSLI